MRLLILHFKQTNDYQSVTEHPTPTCECQFSVGFNFQRGVIQYGCIPLFSCKCRCTVSAILNLTASETGNLVVFARVASEGGQDII